MEIAEQTGGRKDEIIKEAVAVIRMSIGRD